MQSEVYLLEYDHCLDCGHRELKGIFETESEAQAAIPEYAKSINSGYTIRKIETGVHLGE